jgi:hypothetical protein
MLTYTYPIWLLFGAFFFYNAYARWREAHLPMRPFVAKGAAEGKAGEPASGLAEAGAEFVREFNAYLDSVNRASLRRNRAMAVGYALSGVVALISMFLVLAGQ